LPFVADFFSNGHDRKEMYASHFVDTMPIIELIPWKRRWGHINEHVMHLGAARIANTRPWTGADNKAMLEEFGYAWDNFYNALKPGLAGIR
jgi:hypothetical protein